MGKRGNEKAKARAKIALFVASHTTKKGQVRVPWSPELEAQLGRDRDMGAVSRETSGRIRGDGRPLPNREAPKPSGDDGDAETSPFAGRRSVPDYVKPEPAVGGASPSREVLAVIEVAGGSHVT